MIKKYVLTLLAFFFFVATSPVHALSRTPSPFLDVSSTNAYFMDIDYLYNLKFVHGDEKGNFNPDQSMNRCELVKLTLKVKEYLLPSGSAPHVQVTPSTTAFPDIPLNSWCNSLVWELKTAGALDGDERGNFDPWRYVSAAEAFKMIIESVSPEDFSEFASDGQWQNNYASYVVGKHLENYSSVSVVQVNEPISRKSIVRIIRRFIDLQYENNENIYLSSGLTSSRILLVHDIDLSSGRKISFELDKVRVNKNFLPGVNDYYLNSRASGQELVLSSDAQFYRCGPGPDQEDTTADVEGDMDRFIVDAKEMVGQSGLSTYHFDIGNSQILNVYESCLP